MHPGLAASRAAARHACRSAPLRGTAAVRLPSADEANWCRSGLRQVKGVQLDARPAAALLWCLAQHRHVRQLSFVGMQCKAPLRGRPRHSHCKHHPAVTACLSVLVQQRMLHPQCGSEPAGECAASCSSRYFWACSGSSWYSSADPPFRVMCRYLPRRLLLVLHSQAR